MKMHSRVISKRVSRLECIFSISFCYLPIPSFILFPSPGYYLCISFHPQGNKINRRTETDDRREMRKAENVRDQEAVHPPFSRLHLSPSLFTILLPIASQGGDRNKNVKAIGKREDRSWRTGTSNFNSRVRPLAPIPLSLPGLFWTSLCMVPIQLISLAPFFF